MNRVSTFLLALPRRAKRFIQVAMDIVLVWVALWLSFLVRLGIEEPLQPLLNHPWLFIAAPAIAIPLFIRFGMYRAVMRYFGNDALIAIVKAVSLSSLVLALVVFWYSDRQTAIVPRSIIFNYWWLSMVILGGLRLAMRQYFMGDWFNAFQRAPSAERETGLKVAIYGAGVAGNQLLAALRMGRGMRPVAFIDDDPNIADRVIAGLQVFSPKHIQRMIDLTGAEELLLALPSSRCMCAVCRTSPRWPAARSR
jgi:FlaA1/EpsC-like NDP-sugar epimerase